MRLARERPGELTLVALAPLTNLALALRLDPTLPSRIARLVVMGGAVNGRGNTERVPAEFNIGFDPEAAHVVFSAWPRVRSRRLGSVPSPHVRLRAVRGDARARRCARAFLRGDLAQDARVQPRARAARRRRGGRARDGGRARSRRSSRAPETRHVAIETAGALTRGATVVDWEDRLGPTAERAHRAGRRPGAVRGAGRLGAGRRTGARFAAPGGRDRGDLHRPRPRRLNMPLFSRPKAEPTHENRYPSELPAGRFPGHLERFLVPDAARRCPARTRSSGKTARNIR